MKTNKFLVGGIIGGIVSFFFGWLVWGMLLKNFMTEHTTEAGKSVIRAEADMIWWALIVGNLLLGFLFAFILMKAGVKSAGAGAGIGAVVGLLMSGAFDLFNYSMSNMGDTTSIIVDVLTSMVAATIICTIIGWFYGRGAKTAA